MGMQDQSQLMRRDSYTLVTLRTPIQSSAISGASAAYLVNPGKPLVTAMGARMNRTQYEASQAPATTRASTKRRT